MRSYLIIHWHESETKRSPSYVNRIPVMLLTIVIAALVVWWLQ